MIREYWERAKAVTTQSQKDVMEENHPPETRPAVEKTPQLELAPVVQSTMKKSRTLRTGFWLLPTYSN